MKAAIIIICFSLFTGIALAIIIMAWIKAASKKIKDKEVLKRYLRKYL